MRTVPSPAFRFTLIELLVVVAIIALLASLLLPALSKARGEAVKSNCRSQLRQIAIGHASYADESDDWYPRVRYTSYAAIEPEGDDMDMAAYYGGIKTLVCPSHRFAGTIATYDVGRFHVNRLYTSYRFLASRGTHADGDSYFFGHWNAALSSSPASQYRSPVPRSTYLERYVQDPAGLNLKKVYLRDAASQPLAVDGVAYNATQKWFIYSGSHPQWNNHIATGGTNLVFIDGHGQWSNIFASSPRLQLHGTNDYMTWD